MRSSHCALVGIDRRVILAVLAAASACKGKEADKPGELSPQEPVHDASVGDFDEAGDLDASASSDFSDPALDGDVDVDTDLDAAQSCDDLNPCTIDSPTDGGCSHAPVICGDSNVCTLDICQHEGGCQHIEVPEACSLSPCGPCPIYDGFECVQQGDQWTCESDSANEVFVPAGAYWRGCNPFKGAEQCGEDTKPQHKIYESDFIIDRTEVTREAWDVCRLLDVCIAVHLPSIERRLALQSDTPQTPMRHIDLFEAATYCTWAGKHLCWDAEWEKAARGGCIKNGCADDDDDCCRAAMPIYPWGFAPSPDCPATVACYLDAPLEVGSRPLDRSPYGALDMAANVAEWCRDGFQKYSALVPTDGSTLTDPQFDGGEEWDMARTARGAGYGSGNVENAGWQAAFRTDNRWLHYPYSADGGVGFRCCRDFP